MSHIPKNKILTCEKCQSPMYKMRKTIVIGQRIDAEYFEGLGKTMSADHEQIKCGNCGDIKTYAWLTQFLED